MIIWEGVGINRFTTLWFLVRDTSRGVSHKPGEGKNRLKLRVFNLFLGAEKVYTKITFVDWRVGERLSGFVLFLFQIW